MLSLPPPCSSLAIVVISLSNILGNYVKNFDLWICAHSWLIPQNRCATAYLAMSESLIFVQFPQA